MECSAKYSGLLNNIGIVGHHGPSPDQILQLQPRSTPPNIYRASPIPTNSVPHGQSPYLKYDIIVNLEPHDAIPSAAVLKQTGLSQSHWGRLGRCRGLLCFERRFSCGKQIYKSRTSSRLIYWRQLIKQSSTSHHISFHILCFEHLSFCIKLDLT